MTTNALIYWDTQDPQNIGWGYRTPDGDSGGFDMDLVSPQATDEELRNHYFDEVDQDADDVEVNREGCPVSAAEAERAWAKSHRGDE